MAYTPNQKKLIRELRSATLAKREEGLDAVFDCYCAAGVIPNAHGRALSKARKQAAETAMLYAKAEREADKIWQRIVENNRA